MANHGRSHRLSEQRIELAVVAEHDVAAEVPGESGRIDDRTRQSPDHRAALVHTPVAMPEALELTGGPQPTGTGADDGDPGCLVDRHGGPGY